MNETGDRDSGEFDSVAERELHRTLDVVRSDPPTAEPNLGERVARTLHWQALVVVPLTAGLALAGGVASGLRTLARGGRS